MRNTKFRFWLLLSILLICLSYGAWLLYGLSSIPWEQMSGVMDIEDTMIT